MQGLCNGSETQGRYNLEKRKGDPPVPSLLLAPPVCCCLHCGHLQDRHPHDQRLVCPVCETVLIEPLAP